MKFKKFKSIDNSKKYVSILTGHTFRIGKEWTSIPEHAWQDCYAAGCLSEDMTVNSPLKDKQKEDREVIRRVMLKWYENSEIDKFDKISGKPNVSKLQKETGINAIHGNLRNQIWSEIQQELK